jgi:antitoxin component YwqK of YwqJK toxin-antitoxin module
MVVADYVAGVQEGAYRSLHPSGICLREGFKKNGQWHGSLITRGTLGRILDISQFNEGTGVYRIFSADETLVDEIPIVRGKPHGVALTWRRDSIVVTRCFKHGQCVAASIGRKDD